MSKIKLTNDRSTFLTMYLEPWGEDFGMSPGDEFEIIAVDASEDVHFHVISEDNKLKLYVEGKVEEVTVYQRDVELSCGHNRRKETW